MTESTFPFAGLAGPPPGQDDGPGNDERTGTRRALVLGGGAAAALVLAAGLFLTLGGAEEEELGAGTVVRAPRAAAAATTTSPAPKLPVPFDEDLGRDPFRALYVEPVADTPAGSGPATASAPPGAARPAGAAVPVGVEQPVVRPAPVQPVAPAAAPPSGTAAARPAAPAPAATAREHRLVLVGVTERGDALEAAFTIDGARTTARVGEVFGPKEQLRLVSLQEGPAAGQWTAVLQVGDGEPFDVVTGRAVPVR